MRIWLVTIGEPLPTDSADERLLRTGILAEMMAAGGHEVVWWTSAFNHTLKAFRAHEDRSVDVRPGLRIKMLFGGGYRRNVSFARISDHRRLAQGFARLASAEAVPDVILCSFPPIELSLAAVDYARTINRPVILDIRDLWPDVFLDVVPSTLRPAGRLALRGMYRTARRACANASFIWGHAPGFVEWGLAHAGRPAGTFDRPFAFGYLDSPPSDADRTAAEKTWDTLGVVARDDQLIACFTGTLGRQVDIMTVLAAAAELRDDSRIRFVICGTGDRVDFMKSQMRELPNVLFPGWRTRAEIWTLLRRASVGIAPYIDRADFVATIPNKAPEYWSGGLPIALSLDRGLLKDLLDENECGFSYRGDASTLASRLQHLAIDRSALRSLSANALRLYNSRFRADVVYSEMIATLEDIAASCHETSAVVGTTRS